MYDDVLGIAGAGTAAGAAVLATTGIGYSQFLILAWGLCLAGVLVLAGTARVRARAKRRG
ncbi:hypothetical protein [Nitriliruptor alkaliphilus]|uniref:hypothetical protein n=1 Tax=Nitriliruptor alkaliphilus TaxID=427918 RepID=UPI0006976390|nr:hypothetical protein [Nitriliruptor alkaliphilus]